VAVLFDAGRVQGGLTAVVPRSAAHSRLVLFAPIFSAHSFWQDHHHPLRSAEISFDDAVVVDVIFDTRPQSRARCSPDIAIGRAADCEFLLRGVVRRGRSAANRHPVAADLGTSLRGVPASAVSTI
jgi:hypothetical protein